jgi:hypothetical protein
MASQLQSSLYRSLSTGESELLIGGLSEVGPEAATFSRSTNNSGGNEIVQTFPGAKSRWTALPLNQLAIQTSDLKSVDEAFKAD